MRGGLGGPSLSTRAGPLDAFQSVDRSQVVWGVGVDVSVLPLEEEAEPGGVLFPPKPVEAHVPLEGFELSAAALLVRVTERGGVSYDNVVGGRVYRNQRRVVCEQKVEAAGEVVAFKGVNVHECLQFGRGFKQRVGYFYARFSLREKRVSNRNTSTRGKR